MLGDRLAVHVSAAACELAEIGVRVTDSATDEAVWLQAILEGTVAVGVIRPATARGRGGGRTPRERIVNPPNQLVDGNGAVIVPVIRLDAGVESTAQAMRAKETVDATNELIDRHSIIPVDVPNARSPTGGRQARESEQET